MEYILAAQKVTLAAKEMAGTIVKKDSDVTEHKLQLLSKTVVKS